MVLIAAPIGACGITAAAAAPVRRAAQFSRVQEPTQESANAFAAAAVAMLAGATATESVAETELAAAESTPEFGDAIVFTEPVAPVVAGAQAAPKALWLSRPLMLLGGGAAAAALVAGGLVFAVWPGDETPSTAAPAVVAPAPTVAETSPPTEAAVAVAPAAEPETAATSTKVSPERAASEEAIATNAPQTLPEQNSPVAATTTSQSPPPAAALASPPATAQTVPVANATPPRTQVFKIDPLNFDDPSSLSLSALGNAATPGEASKSPSANETALASAGAGSKLPIDKRDLQPPVENQSVMVRRGPPAEKSTQLPAAAARLSLPIREVSLKAAPLSRAVEQLSDLAGLPVTLDPAALLLTGVSPRREVSIEIKDGTVGKTLTDVLTPHRLSYVERDGQIVVTRAENRGKLPAAYDVADLVNAGEKDAGQLAEVLMRFVSPETWQAAGGIGTISVQGNSLDVKQSEAAYIELIVLCERMRVARGLAPKSRYPADRLLTESPYQQLGTKLGASTTFTFAPWTRLADVVRDWSERSGITMLVDWQALDELELSPASPVACSAISRTWREALDGILPPLDLSWRAIDGETIQITTAAAAQRDRRVEFFKIPASRLQQFSQDRALVESLQGELREQRPEIGSPVEMHVVDDRVMVLATADVHRYLSQKLLQSQN